MAKFSFNNTLEWQKTFGGSEDDRAADIVQTLDGGFAVLGFSKSSDRDCFSKCWISGFLAGKTSQIMEHYFGKNHLAFLELTMAQHF